MTSQLEEDGPFLAEKKFGMETEFPAPFLVLL